MAPGSASVISKCNSKTEGDFEEGWFCIKWTYVAYVPHSIIIGWKRHGQGKSVAHTLVSIPTRSALYSRFVAVTTPIETLISILLPSSCNFHQSMKNSESPLRNSHPYHPLGGGAFYSTYRDIQE